MKIRGILALYIAAVVVGLPAAAAATDYHFCVSSDRRPGNVLVQGGTVDFGKEWYRERAAQTFCQVYGASGCSASDFGPTCRGLRQETLSFKQILPNGNQVGAIFSGDPVALGQGAVELLVNTPATTIKDVGRGVPKVAKKVCRWVAKHC